MLTYTQGQLQWHIIKCGMTSLFETLIISVDWTEYQCNFDVNNSNIGDRWNQFKSKGMHFIHLNINSLLPKIEEICHLKKLTNAPTIGISETYHMILWYYKIIGAIIKSSVAYINKTNMHVNMESFFTEIYLHKSKSFIVGILHRPPDKINLINCIDKLLVNKYTRNPRMLPIWGV